MWPREGGAFRHRLGSSSGAEGIALRGRGLGRAPGGQQRGGGRGLGERLGEQRGGRPWPREGRSGGRGLGGRLGEQRRSLGRVGLPVTAGGSSGGRGAWSPRGCRGRSAADRSGACRERGGPRAGRGRACCSNRARPGRGPRVQLPRAGRSRLQVPALPETPRACSPGSGR